jgi:hypothetical protein
MGRLELPGASFGGEKIGSEIEIHCVHPDNLSLVWCSIEPWLLKAMTDDFYLPSDVADKILNREMQCWIATENGKFISFAITSIVSYPRAIVGQMHWVGGERMETWLYEGMAILEEFFKSNGCRAWLGYYRRGWKKKVHFDHEGAYYLKKI